MADTIKVIRFISGEDVVATVTSQDDNKIVLDKPLTIVYKPAGEGQVSIGFGAFMPYADPTSPIELNVSAIAGIIEPMSSLVNEYQRIFSPIIQPSNEIVTGPKLVR